MREGRILTRAIVPDNGKGFPRFKGKAHVAECRFRTARIGIREIPASTSDEHFLEAVIKWKTPYRASIFMPPDHDSYLTRDSFLGWRKGSISIEAQKAPMRNTPCTAIWRVINRLLMVYTID